MSDQYPVTVAVRRPDGSIEHVRVGTATKSGDGFSLKLGELAIGGTPDAARRAPAASAGGGMAAASGDMPTTLPNYGRSKGAPIRGASMQDLEYYKNGALRSLNDPAKARWHDKERALLAAIEAEIARQGGGGGDEGGPVDGPPPHGDDDIPF
ncbi:MAG: hypothetical protein ACK4N5_05725 [Myxococcales bacterium]